MKLKTWVKRWAVSEKRSGLVDFYHVGRPYATSTTAQIGYDEFLRIFGIPLEPEKMYSLKVKGTARPS